MPYLAASVGFDERAADVAVLSAFGLPSGHALRFLRPSRSRAAVMRRAGVGAAPLPIG